MSCPFPSCFKIIRHSCAHIKELSFSPRMDDGRTSGLPLLFSLSLKRRKQTVRSTNANSNAHTHGNAHMHVPFYFFEQGGSIIVCVPVVGRTESHCRSLACTAIDVRMVSVKSLEPLRRQSKNKLPIPSTAPSAARGGR